MMTLRKIGVKPTDDESAKRIASYRLDPRDAPEAYGGTPRAGTMWLGSDAALATIGVTRGAEVSVEELALAMQGKHVVTEAQIRQPGGPDGVVNNIEMTVGLKDLGILWSQANDEQRQEIEQIILEAANAAAEHMTQTKKIVVRRIDGTRVREEAMGMVGAASLQVTARRAEGDLVAWPLLHVHFMLVGVETRAGRVVTPDSWDMFRHDHALEGGAVFRAKAAEGLVNAGYSLEAETGKKGRFFRIKDVPDALVERMSSRSREVEEEIARQEELLGRPLTGGALGMVAMLTRLAKEWDLTPQQRMQIWDAVCQEYEFGHAQAAAARNGPKGFVQPLDVRRKEWLEAFERKIDERGPTVTRGTAVASAYEVAPTRLAPHEVHAMLSMMDAADELIPLDKGRATTRAIREMEEYVLDTAVAAARVRRPPLSQKARQRGLDVANAGLGAGKSLDPEQREAFERLTGGADWGILTGNAGTGKGPTLHAVVAAHLADGWQVIDCAADGSTAQRLGEQTASDAYTIDQVKMRVQLGSMAIDGKTLILVDEATKVRRGLWHEIAMQVRANGARVIPVGHTGQLDAVTQPGVFAAMIKTGEIDVLELTEIRRHRDPSDPSKVHPWLKDYQVALNDRRAEEAVDLLARHDALHVVATRREAMERMVDDWDVWRRAYDPLETLLLVHGPNTDIDEVNRLVQKKRIAAGELAGSTVKVVDRDYDLYCGEVVMLRNAGYRFPEGSRERRIENGTVGVVTMVDAENDRMRVTLSEPGKAPREVEIDLAPLRAAHAAGEPRVPSFRPRTAAHTYPMQGITVKRSAVVAGHWSQGKEASYVADTRAVQWHDVYTSHQDLGSDGTAASARHELARRMARSMNRAASVAYGVDEGARVNTRRVTPSPVPEFARREREPAELAPEPAEPVQAAEPEEEPTFAEVRREDIAVPDPVAAWEEPLGSRRADDIRKRSAGAATYMRGLGYEDLRHQRDMGLQALNALDPDGARAIVRLENERSTIASRMFEAENLAGRLRGTRASRRRRAEYEAQAKRQDGLVAHDVDRLAKLDAEMAKQRKRWDLDRWMKLYSSRVELWAAAEREMAIRRGIEVELIAQRAPYDPAEHIRDAIGDRPPAAAPERGEWDALASDLERDRMRAELAYRDGAQVTIDRAQQVELVRRIQEMQELREQAQQEVVRGDDGREMA